VYFQMSSNELNLAYANPQPILTQNKSKIISNPLIQPAHHNLPNYHESDSFVFVFGFVFVCLVFLGVLSLV